jgi:hypothetical protein
MSIRFVNKSDFFMGVFLPCERIDDTKMLAGSEAYNVALSLYKSFGSAADAGVLGADSIVDQLKQRFASKTTSEPVTAPPAPPMS